MSQHPSSIPWPTLGVVEAFLIGVGIAVLSVGEPDAWDFLVARGCFVLACFFGAIQIVLLARGRRGRMPYLVAFLLCGVFGATAVFGVNYVNRKRDIWSGKNSSKGADRSSPITDPIVHLEPEQGPIWSTNPPGQRIGAFTLSFHNTGLEDITNINVSQDYFVAEKSKDIIIKRAGGMLIPNVMPEVLASKEKQPIEIDLGDHIDVLNEVADSFKGPSLRGVKVTVRFRRRADGKDFSIVRMYGIIGPKGEGLMMVGDAGDPAPIPLRNQFLTLSELVPYQDASDHWTPIEKHVSWDFEGRVIEKHR